MPVTGVKTLSFQYRPHRRSAPRAVPGETQHLQSGHDKTTIFTRLYRLISPVIGMHRLILPASNG